MTMQKTISIIVFLTIITVIRAQENTDTVKNRAGYETMIIPPYDQTILGRYRNMLKTLFKYGVPFKEGNIAIEDINKHFRDDSSKRPLYLLHNIPISNAKDKPKDEKERKKPSIIFYYNKYLENLIKRGIKVRNPNNERYTTSKGRAQYLVGHLSSKGKAQFIDGENEAFGTGPDGYNNERFTTSKGRPLYQVKHSSSKGRAQYLERDKK